MDRIEAESEALAPHTNRLNENSILTTTTASKLESAQSGSIEDKIEQIYQDIGGLGKFQVFATITFLLGLSGQNWWFYVLGYLTQEPDSFVCTYATEFYQPACTKENICAGNPAITSWEADPDSDKTLYNWQQQLDLTCVDEWKVGMLGSGYFLGWCSTLLWMPGLSVKYGRRYLYWASIVVVALSYLTTLITGELIVMCIATSVQGMMSSLRVNVGYVYFMEMMPKSMQTPVTTVWCICDAVIYLLASVYFWKISKHAIYFEAVGLVWTCIGVLSMIWVPESPRYLISIGKLDEARAIF
mmetsp:Transcript_1601/g.2370  ORF Transcript_1601/g.2370 Transcript_1601/m.2370 type:complete len:300 (-) Transcript_1601:727-1626(-)